MSTWSKLNLFNTSTQSILMENYILPLANLINIQYLSWYQTLNPPLIFVVLIMGIGNWVETIIFKSRLIFVMLLQFHMILSPLNFWHLQLKFLKQFSEVKVSKGFIFRLQNGFCSILDSDLLCLFLCRFIGWFGILSSERNWSHKCFSTCTWVRFMPSCLTKSRIMNAQRDFFCFRHQKLGHYIFFYSGISSNLMVWTGH